MEGEVIDGPAVPNSPTPEKDGTLIQGGGGGGGGQDEGSKDASTIHLLHQEIDGLKRERSELQERLDAALAKVEQSEVTMKATAAHASQLEGDLMHTQQDLTAASSVAEDAEAEAQGLRRSIQDIEAEKDALAVSKAALESQIRALEEKVAAYTSLDADLTAEREKVAAAESRREEEISALALKEKNLEVQLRILGEEKEMVVEEAKRRTSLEEELEKAIMELMGRNSELEGKINGFTSTIDRDLSVGQKMKQAGITAAEGLTVSWTVAAAAAASTATVAVVITAACLRARQR